MADPLTLSTGVAGFLSLALQIGKILHDYSSGIKNAPKDVRDLFDEVQALAAVFEQLQVLLRTPELMTRLPLFSSQSVLHKVLVSAGEELKELYRTLLDSPFVKGNDKNQLERSFDRFKWPLGKPRLQDCTRRLYQLSQALSFSLTISNCEIMSQACDEILETIHVKNAQLDSLRAMIPQLPDELSRLSDQMKSVIDLIPLLNGLNGDMQNLALGVKSLELDLDNKTRDRYFNWFSSLDPPTRHLDDRSSRTGETGQWFLDDQTVQKWETGPRSSVLLCFGIPGAGKTVLMSLLIDHLKTRSKSENLGFAYVYCDYRDQTHQSPTNILGALLKQLLQPLGNIPDYALHICGDAFRASEVFDLSMAEHLLELTCREFDKIYICLDALDECSQKTISTLLSSFKKLRTALSMGRDLDDDSTRPFADQSTAAASNDSRSQSSLKLVITSRPHLESLLVNGFGDPSSLAIEAQESDIRTFVKAKIEDDLDPYLMNDDLRHEIVEKIVHSSQKMFLLPALQINSVLEGRTLFERRENMRNFSSDLDGAFAKVLSRIRKQPESSSKTALKIIAWTHLTTRPLQISEMFHALATNQGDVSVNWDNFQSPATWLQCCLGLVIVDKETSTVRLVHNSFDQYLARQGRDVISLKDTHLQIAETCLTYLNLEDVCSYASKEFAIGNQRDNARLGNQDDGNFNSRTPEIGCEDGGCEDVSNLPHNSKLIGYYAFSESSVSKICQQYPFVSYAAAYWGYHARKYETVPELLRQSVSRYIRQPQSELKWSLPSLLLSFSTPPTWWDIPKHCETFTGLHIASYFGLGPVIDDHCRSFCDPLSHTYDLLALNAPDHDGRTPLSWAAESGSESAVQALLNYPEINIGKADRDNRTPLSWACAHGHVLVVKLLLKYGAKTYFGESEQEFGQQRTPLHLACHFGHIEVVKILLQHGAPADSRNISTFGRLICPDPRPPLMLAASKGYDVVAELLLDTRIEVDPRDVFGRTPLLTAVENNHISTAVLLLNNGADANAQNNEGRTPLMLALSGENLDMVELLLQSGADVNQRAHRTGTTALMLAATHKGVSVAKFLLDHGADVDTRDARGFTALTCASEAGYVPLAKLLISRGANPNSITNAIEGSNKAYSNVFMDEVPVSVLGHAFKNGKQEMVEFLFSAGVEIDCYDSRRQTLLFYAVRVCDVSMVKHLLQLGAAVDFVDSEGRTPLVWAIDPLIAANHRQPPNFPDPYEGYLTSRIRRLEQLREKTLHEMVLLLFAAGAALCYRDPRGRSALSYAAQRRYDHVIQVLCDHGSNVDQRDQDGRTPLSWAAEGYWCLPTQEYMSNSSGTTALQYLLDKGADVNGCDIDGRPPLWWAASHPENHEAINFLIARTAVFYFPTPQTLHPSAKRLSYHDLFMFYEGKSGTTPIIHGLRGNSSDVGNFRLETLDGFLQHGFDLNAKLENGQTLLFWAQSQQMEFLLSRGANINITDLQGRTPLFLEVTKRVPDVDRLRELISYDAVVNVRDNTGHTPLSWLMSRSEASPDAISLLLELGADSQSC